jgi:hypothetical protein
LIWNEWLELINDSLLAQASLKLLILIINFIHSYAVLSRLLMIFIERTLLDNLNVLIRLCFDYVLNCVEETLLLFMARAVHSI